MACLLQGQCWPRAKVRHECAHTVIMACRPFAQFLPRSLPCTGSAPPVWWAGGFTGHGMSMGYLFGRQSMGEMLAGEVPQLSLPLSRFGVEAELRG